MQTFYKSRVLLPRLLISTTTFVVVVDCKTDQMNMVTDVYLFKPALHLLFNWIFTSLLEVGMGKLRPREVKCLAQTDWGDLLPGLF